MAAKLPETLPLNLLSVPVSRGVTCADEPLQVGLSGGEGSFKSPTRAHAPVPTPSSRTALAALSSQVDLSGSVAEQTISGKNVFVYTDSDGNNAYVVPLGDTLVFFDSVTAGEAKKTIEALR